MIQETISQFLIKVVAGKNFSDNTIPEIKSNLMEKLGEIDVHVKIVNQISDPKTRKNRQFISKICCDA